jgi:hypothetical protein
MINEAKFGAAQPPKSRDETGDATDDSVGGRSPPDKNDGKKCQRTDRDSDRVGAQLTAQRAGLGSNGHRHRGVVFDGAQRYARSEVVAVECTCLGGPESVSRRMRQEVFGEFSRDVARSFWSRRWGLDAGHQ